MSIKNMFGDDSENTELDEVVDQSLEANEPEQTEQADDFDEEPAEQVVTSTQSEPAKHSEREDKGHNVPLHVALDWRDENKALKRQLQEYNRQQQEAQRNRRIPDVANDPYAFAQYQQQVFQEQLRDQALNTSYRFAATTHGQDVVDKATQWAYNKGMADPAFDFAFSQQQDPVAWVVSQYKQDELLNQVQSDPDAYVRRRAMELGLIPNSGSQQSGGAPLNTSTNQPAKKLPSGSIASAPSAGKSSEPATDNPIGRMFNNK